MLNAFINIFVAELKKLRQLILVSRLIICHTHAVQKYNPLRMQQFASKIIYKNNLKTVHSFTLLIGQTTNVRLGQITKKRGNGKSFLVLQQN